ncbi:hypothetical protein CSHISOI_10935 [Colletotrichum shisoi]|uniref:Uncharacterized protein n=1 Tax=Colletotrichum shisoi TaxID=2078593 RepID=A0A5Q4BC08_9PEZI|nr:hypothetical protein CSHISOI_10935 [Colletotrichum shisoi]
MTLTCIFLQASVIAVIAGALAAAVNGVPIIDNSNKAVTQAVQARAASGVAVAHGIIHGVGPHRFDHIHGPPVANITSSKKPGIIDIIRPSVSFQDAHTQTEMPSGKKSGVIDIIRPSVSFQDVHTQTEMPTSVSFQTASTLTQNLEIKTCVIRYNPNSGASFNDCPGQSSDDIRMERTQMPGMPTKSISMSTPATNTAHSTSTRVGNVEWIEWYLLCSGDFFGWVPTHTALTAINKKTSSTEAEPTLMLTTDSTALAVIDKKTSSTEAEPTLMLTTIASMITPTPTEEEATPNTSTSTVTETEDPIIEYTFAKVAKSLIVTRLG